jgi:hypothetical protein
MTVQHEWRETRETAYAAHMQLMRLACLHVVAQVHATRDSMRLLRLACSGTGTCDAKQLAYSGPGACNVRSCGFCSLHAVVQVHATRHSMRLAWEVGASVHATRGGGTTWSTLVY